MVSKLKFVGLLPNIVEACSFIPSKYKGHTTFINKALHALTTPLMIIAFFFLLILPEVSGSIVMGSMALHLIGHFFEGILN